MSDSPQSGPDPDRSVAAAFASAGGTPAGTEWLSTLADRARAADSSPPFSDGALVEYRQGGRSLVAIDEVAAALLRTSAGAGSPAEAEFVVDPDARGRGNGTTLLEILLSRSAHGLLVWAHGDHPAARALAASHALAAVRTLLHLEAAVPEPAPVPAPTAVPEAAPVPAPTTVPELDEGPRVEPVDTNASDRSRQARPAHTRPFRVGTDEQSWLDLNARAFAAHDEQGRVSMSDLRELEAEPWFRADDFLLLWDADALLGYCWLKVEGNRGEFYVVGVDPDRQGEGLGRQLVQAGFARLAARGIHRAHLYVEGDNEPALRLYRSFGFENASVDIQYASRSGG